MSGHSKWATIKRQKGATDAKRGVLFTKLANAIILAVRDSGDPSPESNFKLRLTIDKARQSNMPKENIERAIKRGAGEGTGGQLESILYEGFGPGGVGFLIEALTDNKNRAASEIRTLLTKFGGSLGEPNSVRWQFNPAGLIWIALDAAQDRETMEAAAIEAGAEDVQWHDEGVEIITTPESLAEVQKALTAKGYTISQAELGYRAKTPLEISGTDAGKIVELSEALDELPDVNSVFSNNS
ncbi:MAG: YebC/PmpR family DNA-binding transcriptional regulator [bacterium]|nr:YebC/PmpR family DNA-binding transcriptional regulator [bacterium]